MRLQLQRTSWRRHLCLQLTPHEPWWLKSSSVLQQYRSFHILFYPILFHFFFFKKKKKNKCPFQKKLRSYGCRVARSSRSAALIVYSLLIYETLSHSLGTSKNEK